MYKFDDQLNFNRSSKPVQNVLMSIIISILIQFKKLRSRYQTIFLECYNYAMLK